MDNRQDSSSFVARVTPDERSEQVATRKATFSSSATRGGVCVADGFGVKVNVEAGALVVSDGVGGARRTRRYDKATHGLRRLVVMRPGAGYVTWEALSWCSALRIGVLVVDRDGSAELASTPRAGDDARLRRVQALASSQSVGLEVARWLLAAKVRGQARLLAARFGPMSGLEPGTGKLGTVESVASLAAALEVAEDIEAARQLEASAAALYFSAWVGANVAPRFRSEDRRRLPEHWTSYVSRRSVLANSGANRKAERPVNALLNYVFSLVEAEAVLACHAVGLDPGLGVVHNDVKGRASLALDIMEPVRPQAEAFVLDLLAARTFRKAEFTEAPDGHVRLVAPLTHQLAESLPTWSTALAPVAEKVAHMLGWSLEGRFNATTPLTSQKVRAAQAAVQARKSQARARVTRKPLRQTPAPTRQKQAAFYSCTGCGGPVVNARHTRCAGCQQADPRQAPAVRASRALAISRARRRDAAFAGSGYYGPQDWLVIRGGLQGVRLSSIMARCGVSKSTAWSWKTGQTMPAPGHWAALAELGPV
jgi:CRISPR-associated endonuclease Cas1